jgi:alpha-tubulin suppressor-like RCC1 family protein
MTTSAKTLQTQITSRLAAGGLTPLSCCQLQGAQCILDTQAVVSFSNLAALPTATLNQGRMVYLQDTCQYRVSDGICWTTDFRSIVQRVEPSVFSWGANGFGQLGDNTVTCRSSPVREISNSGNWCQTSAGGGHTSAIKTDGSLWSWGYNTGGSLGDNTTTSRSSPVREISSSSNWCQIAFGASIASAVKTDGSLWTWGCGIWGQLGDNSTNTRSSPVREITSSTNWCQTSPGSQVSSAVKTDSTLWVWGRNFCGTLGDGTSTNRSSPVREALSSTSWCQTASGSNAGTAVKTDGTLWTWGYGSCGVLGNNTTACTGVPGREITSSNNWCRTSTSRNQTVSALKTDGSLWNWGRNQYGQLGDNTTTGRSSPVREISSFTTWFQTSASAHISALKILTCKGFL